MAATLCLASRSYEGRRRRDTTAGASLGFANLEKRRVVSAPAVIADRPEFRFGMNSGARGRRRCSPKALADRLICAGEQAQQRGAFVGERAPGRLAAWLPEWTMRGTASSRRSLSLATFAEVPRDTADLRGIDLTHVCDPYTGTTPESTVPAASALMPSGRLCRDGVTRMHVFPAQEEIDLAVTRHNRRPIADLHHLRRGSYWRSATVIKRAGDRGELTPNPSCVRQWQMRPYLSAAQSRAAAASHLRWRSSRPSQQCVLLCRVARHAKSR